MEQNVDPVVVEMQQVPNATKPARPKSGGVTDIVRLSKIYKGDTSETYGSEESCNR
jgi:hypothetical protein